MNQVHVTTLLRIYSLTTRFPIYVKIRTMYNSLILQTQVNVRMLLRKGVRKGLSSNGLTF